MSRKLLCIEAVSILLLCGATCVAGDAQLIAARIANFREMGTAFKAINDELKAKQPDLARLREPARVIKDRGAEIPQWFPPGSEPVAPVEQSWIDSILAWFKSGETLELPDEAKTRAKIETWKEPAQFQASHRNFMLEADNFWQAVQKRSTPAIEVRFRALGKTCESCHKNFREEE